MAFVDDEIITIEHKSCATLTIQCLADSGICSWETAFDEQIANAKKLGLMPDDFKVIRETLCNFGFVMQSTALEGKLIKDAIACLGKIDSTATIFIQTPDYLHLGGYMVAFKSDDERCIPINTLPTENYYERYRVAHIWIHWKDEIDRSPFPRKTVKRSKTSSSDRKKLTETACYKPYQPNPCGNYIGDCVVRGTAGAMNISWDKAIDLLASRHETTINAREVYPQVLVDNGFVHHSSPTRGGHRLDGRSFCDEMNKIYHNGERIFAHVGRTHVAAIIPVNDENGNRTYKIIDSWDSSKRLIGEYWVLKTTKKVNKQPSNKDAKKIVYVGNQLRHPTFGEGSIIAMTPDILTIDFGINGTRRLSSNWVLCHCVLIQPT